MSKENYTFDDLDDILAEFYADANAPAEPVVKEPEIKQPAAPAAAAEKPAEPQRKAAPARAPEESRRPSAKKAAAPAQKKPAEPKKNRKTAGSSFEEFEALFSSQSLKQQAEAKRAEMNRAAAEKKAADSAAEHKSKKEIRAEEKLHKSEMKAEKKAEKKSAKQPAAAEAPLVEEAPILAEEDVPAKKQPFFFTLISVILASVCAFAMMGWVLFNVHPASGSSSTVESSTVIRMSEKLDVYMNNVASDALGELAYIKKIYTLQESDTVAPVPKPENFGRTTDVAVIQDVIKRAAPLLEGQTVTFDPNADFVPDTEFMYYLDDTIMVIAWKEYINERCCTMAEVKIAHGSQLRRKLAEDSYSSSVQYYASDMANQSNAVIAINGDFYAFRDLGITVYQRKLYRNNPAQVDSCFFTADGDMLFSRAGELMGEGETQQFIDENNVVFAIAFGPVLVDNGELQYCASYPIGEINTEYSRSCIGMTDKLHYVLMTINHTPDARPRATINELARYIYSKGVQKAYTLDGGQTAEIVMFGAPINHVDFGFERTVSDIIYFATAIPDEEVR